MSAPGQVIRLRKWEHITPNMRVKMGAARGQVGVFVYLGMTHEKEPFDASAALRSLGWYTKEELEPATPRAVIAHSAERVQ